QGLGCGDHVRSDAVEICSKGRAGATGSALYFIEYQERAALGAAPPEALEHRLAYVVGTAHALHRLDDDRGRIPVDELIDGGGIVARRETHVEGRARKTVPFLERPPSHGAGSGGSAVPTLYQRHDLASAGQFEGELQRIFVRFSTAVDPEHRLEAQPDELGQAGGGALADHHGQRIGLEGHLPSLALERSQPARMTVSQARDCVPAVEI